MRKIRYILARILNFPIDPRKDRRVLSMTKSIQELGGLQFSIVINNQGWLAECKNLSGIITGGKSIHPSPAEIDNAIKDAIFSAFAIPAHLCDQRMIKSPFDLDEKRAVEQIDLIYCPQLQLV